VSNPEIVITAGGTKEYIDDVRYVSNFSSGRLGVALANQHAKMGYRVTLLAPNSTMQRFDVDKGIEHQNFVTSEDLDNRLKSFGEGVLAVFQAAAVSDYVPLQVDGKISSTEDELTVKMTRNKKILPELRNYFGVYTQLIGFKLLSHVEEEELIAVAVRQIETAGTDMCVANDLSDVGEERKLHIVDATGLVGSVAGGLEMVADAIAHTASDYRES